MKLSTPAYFSKAIDGLNVFLENRRQNEKNMIFVFLFVLLLTADYFVLVSPVIRVFTVTAPELGAQKQKLREMREDLQNKEAIHKQWLAAGEKLATTQKQFILRSEVPSLLESLSKSAQDCQVKIITLKPADTSDAGTGFLRLPIRLSAVAATHDLGRFLARLEGGPIFFKVTDLRISSNASDEHRHTAELSIETYAKN